MEPNNGYDPADFKDDDICDDDVCYECTGYGDDCYYDEEKNEFINCCNDCPYNRNDDWDDY